VVKEVLNLIRSSLPASIEIRKEIHSDSTIVADPTQIHQIVMNFCTNAGHAMQEKGGTLEVNLIDVDLDADFVSQHPDINRGPHVMLSVKDTGHGIPPQILNQIFDPFFTTKKQGEGTGMGLSVVHGIVKSHQGIITVDSTPGNGTTFTVYFPVVQTETPSDNRTEEHLPTGSETILFIDDEPILAEVGKNMLESLGYTVIVQNDSVRALEMVQAEPEKFQLVITDLTMPKMTGQDLAENIWHIRSDIPIIICTGYHSQVTAGKLKQMGFNALILKPISLEILAQTVRQVLDQSPA
jgi:CheY-like chemotaxis protein